MVFWSRLCGVVTTDGYLVDTWTSWVGSLATQCCSCILILILNDHDYVLETSISHGLAVFMAWITSHDDSRSLSKCSFNGWLRTRSTVLSGRLERRQPQASSLVGYFCRRNLGWDWSIIFNVSRGIGQGRLAMSHTSSSSSSSLS